MKVGRVTPEQAEQFGITFYPLDNDRRWCDVCRLTVITSKGTWGAHKHIIKPYCPIVSPNDCDR